MADKRVLKWWDLLVFLAIMWLAPVGIYIVLQVLGKMDSIQPQHVAGLVLVAAPSGASVSILYICWRVGISFR